MVIVANSARNEYRNKVLDLFLDSPVKLEEESPNRQILALVLVPAWVKEPSLQLLASMKNVEPVDGAPDYMTHRLNNEDSDCITCRVRDLEAQGKLKGNVSVVYVPCYLDGNDGIVNISYYDILPALDMTVFPSYYEPWGYTPLESVAFGKPTVTTDKSGFGQWVLSNFENSIPACSVRVVGRTDSNYDESADAIATELIKYSEMDSK